jgi:hypothetical protein
LALVCGLFLLQWISSIRANFLFRKSENDVKKTPNYCWKIFAICMFFACKYVNTSSLRQLFKTIQGTYLSDFIGHNLFLSTKEQAYILLQHLSANF